MKKSKKSTYILLVVVVGLWIVVFYRIYKSFFSDKNVDYVADNTFVKKAVKAEEDDTFVLQANYPDPFLGRVVIRRAESANPNPGSGFVQGQVKAPVPSRPKKEVVQVDWSFIGYYGLIRNQQSNKQVALVSINGREHMVAEGEKVDEVTFLKNFKDSIKVSYQGATVFLRKK